MYRKNTAGQFVTFRGINASTGAIVTGATWTMRRCLDGTFAAGGATVTEDGSTGFYKAALTQADSNGNNCGYAFDATSCVPVAINIVTTACDPTSTAFGLSLAKTTNITGFNDIAAPTGFAAATFPTGTIANTTNITAGTIATVTNLTNAPTNGDFTATMKTSIGTAVAASAVASVTGNVGGNVTGTVGSVVGAVGSVTGAVGSVTGNVGGNVVGTVASVVGAVGSVANITASGGIVSADIKKVNAVTVTGDGSATPWGP